VNAKTAQNRNAELKALVAAHRQGDRDQIEAVQARLVPDQDDAAAHRRITVALMNAGLTSQAIASQVACVNAGVRSGNRLADDENLLVALILMRGDARGAVEIAQRIVSTWPDYVAGWVNLAFGLTQVGRIEDAADAYRKVLEFLPADLNATDGLARCLGSLGEHDEAIVLGRQSLKRKDMEAAVREKVWDVPETVSIDDGPPRPETHVIAYSLWGGSERYTRTAERNVRIAQDIYPGWSCRIYHDDTVPGDVLERLADLGAHLVAVAQRHVGKEGLMWRFMVADDPGVKRYLVRDADSLLTVRERVAVDDWLASGKPFHVIRDWYSHTDLMLAGLWDGTGGLLPGLTQRINAFFRADNVIDRKIDQVFLGEVVWPSIRHACLTHDDYFGCFGARPFPPFGMLPPGHHVGQNASVHGDA